MTKNTLTTIGQIQNGNVFCFPDDTEKIFIKISHELIKKHKHVYQCQALSVGNLVPRNFKESKTIIYLNKN